jgi:hypothetical protein
MSGLLTELTCPYAVLTSGDVSQRLLNKTNCCLLLSKESCISACGMYLVLDLQCIRKHEEMDAFIELTVGPLFDPELLRALLDLSL